MQSPPIAEISWLTNTIERWAQSAVTTCIFHRTALNVRTPYPYIPDVPEQGLEPKDKMAVKMRKRNCQTPKSEPRQKSFPLNAKKLGQSEYEGRQSLPVPDFQHTTKQN